MSLTKHSVTVKASMQVPTPRYETACPSAKGAKQISGCNTHSSVANSAEEWQAMQGKWKLSV